MLTDAEYQEIMQRRAVLQGDIKGANKDKEKYDQMKQVAQARKDSAEARLNLYTNHLSDDIAEYEAAHPPEPNP